MAATTNEIYLDHNATTAIRPQVITLMADIMGRVGNASSIHRSGRTARGDVERGREQLAALVGASPDNVIFTSGGTEADNLALRGFGKRRLVVSAVEHGAILAPAVLTDGGAVIVEVDEQGRVEPESLRDALKDQELPITVSIMLANNETGVLQPVRELADIAHEFDALVHCDAVQAIGKIPVDMEQLGVDMISISSHKFGGPQGMGALVLASDRAVDAMIVGGGQERGRRAGTENVAGIAGFGLAAEIAVREISHNQQLAEWRDRLEEEIRQHSNQVRIMGEGAERLPNTSCLTMPAVASQTQVISFDLEGIALSAGSACSSGRVSASHVLAAMGVGDEEAMTALRVSMGWCTTEKDVEGFIAAWKKIHDRHARSSDAA